MAAETPRYRKLPGRSGIFVVHRARIDDDHLLAVRTTIFSERYQRIFFRDLQTFSIHPNDRRMKNAFVTGAIALLFALIAWAVFPGGNEMLVLFVASLMLVSVVALVFFVRNLALGRGCVCYARTAVQTVKLPSLNRVRGATRVRSLIAERVAAAQEGLAVEATSSVAADASSSIATPPLVTPRASPSAAARSGSSAAHPGVPAIIDRVAERAVVATGAFALIAAFAMVYDFVEPEISGIIASMLAVLAALAAAITNLVLARNGRLPSAARRPALAVLFATAGGAVAGYVLLMVVILNAVAHGNRTYSRRISLMVALAEQPPGANPFIDVFYIVVSAAFAAIGVWALIVAGRLAVARTRAESSSVAA